MDNITHLLIGIAVAIGVGVIGVVLVVSVEVVVGLLDPKRGPVIRSRSLRENLRHMLH